MINDLTEDFNIEAQSPDWMIPYYDSQMSGVRQELTELIRLLLRQTFVLERKYDKKSGRFQYTKEYRSCSRHLDSHMGIIYIQGENLVGEKLPRLATLYLLILKLIYDEQMENISTSVNVYTTLGDIHEKLGNYRLFKRQPSPSDVRRAITLLKKYQLIDPLDLLDELSPSSAMIIYPCINVVLLGDDVRELLADFEDGEQKNETFAPAGEEDEEYDSGI